MTTMPALGGARLRRRLGVADLGAEHLQAVLHERREARPALGGDELAVHVRAGRAARRCICRRRPSLPARNIRSAATSLPRIVSGTAISTCTPWQMVKIGLSVSWKWRIDRLHALVDADVFRAAPAGDVDGVVVGRLHLREALLQREIVAGLLGVGLVALEIVQRGLQDRRPPSCRGRRRRPCGRPPSSPARRRRSRIPR